MGLCPPTQILWWRDRPRKGRRAFQNLFNLERDPRALDPFKKGNGIWCRKWANTLFWKHPWASDKPLLSIATKIIPSESQDLLVTEYWDPNRGWKWEKSSQYLPNEALGRIAAHELLQDIAAEDRVHWKEDSTGRCKIKSAIQLIRDDPTVENEDSWSWVWKVKAPLRCQFFLWLALHDRLLTNANREKRNLTNNPLCPLCELEYETMDHALRHCPKALTVWQYFQSNGLGKVERQLGFQQWIKYNILNNNFGEDWTTKFVVILWYIWK